MYRTEYQPGMYFAHADKAAAIGKGFDKLSGETAETFVDMSSASKNGTNGHKSHLLSHGTTPARPTGKKEYHSFDPATSRARSSAIEQKLRETPVFRSPHEVHTKRRFFHGENNS